MNAEPGEAIQIALGHKWEACLAVVDEVRPWGVIAYVLIPHNDLTKPGVAYIRLAENEFYALGVQPTLNVPHEG